jgi:PAS domain S-box-containing protein
VNPGALFVYSYEGQKSYFKEDPQRIFPFEEIKMDDSFLTVQQLREENSLLKQKIQELELLEENRKRALEEIKVLKNRLSKAERISHFGNWEFDLSSNRVFSSEGARHVYGLPHLEWTIPEVQKIPLPEYREMLDRALRNLIRENIPYNVEFQICRPDTGGIVDVHSIAEYDRQRNVVFGVLQDITEKKLAEKALRESEQKFRSLIENSHDIVYTLNLEGLLTYVSPSCTLLLGYSTEEVLGKPFMSLLHPDDVGAVIEMFRQLIEKAERQSAVEYRLRHRDGSWRWFMSRGNPILDDSGKMTGYQGITRDISDRKYAEEEMGCRVKLQGILEMAGGICHELNQPMQTISGYADMLLHNLSPEDPIYKKVKIITDQISRVGTITKKLMAIKSTDTHDYAGIGRIVDINTTDKNPNS